MVYIELEEGWDWNWVMIAGLLLDRRGFQRGGVKGKKRGGGGGSQRVDLVYFFRYRFFFCVKGFVVL